MDYGQLVIHPYTSAAPTLWKYAKRNAAGIFGTHNTWEKSSLLLFILRIDQWILVFLLPNKNKFLSSLKLTSLLSQTQRERDLDNGWEEGHPAVLDLWFPLLLLQQDRPHHLTNDQIYNQMNQIYKPTAFRKVEECQSPTFATLQRHLAQTISKHWKTNTVLRFGK